MSPGLRTDKSLSLSISSNLRAIDDKKESYKISDKRLSVF